MKLDESCIQRRCFLRNMLSGGAAAIGACAVGPLLQYAGDFRETPPPDFLVLGRADYELPPGKGKMVLYGHIPALLLQPADGSPLRAFVATCTHLNCTVSYQPEKNRIFCACHNGIYDTRGQVLSGPPPRPLREFYTMLKRGKLILALEKANLEKAP
jgi:cytochrome b6-f complex iron-sulfur subunit